MIPWKYKKEVMTKKKCQKTVYLVKVSMFVVN